MGKIKISCLACNEQGVIKEKEYETQRVVLVHCPACHGEGYVEDYEVCGVKK